MIARDFRKLAARTGLAAVLLAFTASASLAYDPNEPYVREVRGDFVSVVWPWANADIARRARAVAENHCQQFDRLVVFLNVTRFEDNGSARRLAWYRCAEPLRI
jgi:hypothetical protein